MDPCCIGFSHSNNVYFQVASAREVIIVVFSGGTISQALHVLKVYTNVGVLLSSMRLSVCTLHIDVYSVVILSARSRKLAVELSGGRNMWCVWWVTVVR
jgi:hypothetical protein